jgi:hypothetical protein
MTAGVTFVHADPSRDPLPQLGHTDRGCDRAVPVDHHRLGWIDFFRQPISGVISGAGSAFRKVYVVVFLAAWANFATKRRVTDTKMALMKVVS